jgi:hypothetical protein
MYKTVMTVINKKMFKVVQIIQRKLESYNKLGIFRDQSHIRLIYCDIQCLWVHFSTFMCSNINYLKEQLTRIKVNDIFTLKVVLTQKFYPVSIGKSPAFNNN